MNPSKIKSSATKNCHLNCLKFLLKTCAASVGVTKAAGVYFGLPNCTINGSAKSRVSTFSFPRIAAIRAIAIPVVAPFAKTFFRTSKPCFWICKRWKRASGVGVRQRQKLVTRSKSPLAMRPNANDYRLLNRTRLKNENGERKRNENEIQNDFKNYKL